MKRVALKRWLALWVCTALLAGCETMPSGLSSALGSLGGGSSGGGMVSGVQNVVQGASAAFKDYSPQEERELGSGFASVLLGARPLLRNDELQRYVNRVGLWVAGQTDPRKDGQGKPVSYDWRFGVIDSDAVNAYATPGGYVFVTKGLLLALNSEAELAGVLGHEITHVLHGHYLSAVKKAASRRSPAALSRRAAATASSVAP